MKLVIQIPAYNEQEGVSEVLASIPEKISGIDKIDIVLIDDGSTDKTADFKETKNIHIIRNSENMGLSYSFLEGVEYALLNNADILVNIDGDNQYKPSGIEKLIAPILNGEADITIGVRPIHKMKNFSFTKKLLQKTGSLIVKLISSTDIKDAPSGFRAFSRQSLLKLNIFNPFTYTIESIIQARNKNLIIKNVDIDINIQEKRKSRLFKNNLDYIIKQAKNLIRFYIIYQPAKFFSTIACFLFLSGFLIGVRFLYYFINSDGTGHIQSLILSAIIFTLSFICYMSAIMGDLLSINRKLLEDIQFELRQKKYKK